MTSERDFQSKAQISSQPKGETTLFPVIDASGLAPPELGKAIAFRFEQGDQVIGILNLDDVTHSAAAAKDGAHLDINSIVRMARRHLGGQGRREVSILQYEVVYTGSRDGQRLDVVTFKPDIADAAATSSAKRPGFVVSPGPKSHGQILAVAEDEIRWQTDRNRAISCSRW